MTIQRATWAVVLLLALAGCGPRKPLSQPTRTLAEARKGFTTRTTGERSGEPVAPPPPGTLRQITYPSPAGELAAYLSPEPRDGQRHPAIVWITGGDCNTIGDVWSPADPSNDQTAAVFRSSGIVTLYPSLRGGNRNPGVKEGFYGEVEDVIAAGKAVRALPSVDPQRVYLGGHSTGGTLALLVAQMTGDFRGVFAFGPVEDVSGYGSEYLPFDASDPKEVELRSPGHWLGSITSPTWIIEGTDGSGNIASLRAMKAASRNPLVHFVEVEGADHFTVLGPVNELIAGKILKDRGPASSLTLTSEEATGLFRR
jgi:dipeptidyl aminopeptidase/acylaminoacyl peptidase